MMLRENMLQKMLLFTFMVLLSVVYANPVIPGRPLQRQQSIPHQRIPYQVKPENVNQMSEEQVKKAMRDVKVTMNEVQRLLSKDPRLPRLTK